MTNKILWFIKTAAAPRVHTILFGCLVYACLAVLQTTALWADTPDKNRRIEASYGFEGLTPNDTYGSWHTGNLAFYHTLVPGFTYFLNSTFYSRPEGDDVSGAVGAYKDWTDYLYTYSAVTAGSHSSYVPKIRLDHDMNFKFGPNKELVLTAGVTYIDYFSDHRDLILSGGPTIYLDKVIVQYRLFHNESDPGSVISYSHLISLGFGKEGWQWTFFNCSFGNQAYLATSLAIPQAVDNDSIDFSIHHRHWLGEDYGIFGDTGYFKLEDGYEKYLLSAGIFYSF